MKRLIALAILLGVAALGVPAAAASPFAASTLPLIDQRGQHFTLTSLHGRPVVMTFVATRCSDACPLADAAFAQLQRRLPAAHRDALLLTVTLDPRYDTPFVMARQAQAMGADVRRWRLASGTIADVTRLMRAFGVVTQTDEKGIPDVHSTVIFLLDRKGRLAKQLLLSTNTVDAVLAAL
ncbi:SCO family protein [bacterium]|nr:MAG: SCO family protein [bacterium]